MLNLVGFGEKKVSETADMLNMLNFLGFLELFVSASHGGSAKLCGFKRQKNASRWGNVKHVKRFWAARPISHKFRKPQKFNMFNISVVSLTFFSPKPTDFNISLWESFLIPAGEMLNLVLECVSRPDLF